MPKRDFLRLTDLSRKELDDLLQRGMELKRQWKAGRGSSDLARKCLGLIFDKPSTRTRVSFEVAMGQLGGRSLYLDPGTTQIKRGEPVADSARVLSRYLDGLAIRTFDQAIIEEWARWAAIPIINGLTNLLHPCQIFCDLLTLLEKRKSYQGLKLAYIGDGNNIANSWIEAASIVDFQLALACPKGYEPDSVILREARRQPGVQIELTHDPFQAVEGADVVYTDVWASMGQEGEAQKRKRFFKGYQVNRLLLQRARREALVMHCLPAHAGEEISGEVLEGPQSVIFDQAENRLHGQKALLEWMLTRSRPARGGGDQQGRSALPGNPPLSGQGNQRPGKKDGRRK